MSKDNNTLVSNIISRVFDPVVEIPAVIGMAVFFAVQNDLRWRFLLILLFIDAVLPFVFFLIMLKKGEISNWDIRKREERIPLYAFTVIAHLGGVMLAWILDKKELFVILLSFYVLAIVFMLITRKWKISIHGGVNSLIITFLNVLYSWKLWWLYLVVVIVGWARVVGGHHTKKQYIVGAIFGGGLFLVGFYLFSRIFLGI